MKKKSLLFLFTLVLSLLFVNGVDAYTCKYGPDYGGTGEFSASFKVGSTGYAPEVNYTLDTGSDDSIENWQTDIGDGINGRLFQSAKKCPEYIIYIERGTPAPFNTCAGLTERIYISGVISLPDESGNLVEKDFLQDTYNAIRNNNSCITKSAISYLVEQPDLKEEIVEQPTSCTQFPRNATKTDAECETTDSLNGKSVDPACYSCENNPYFACLWIETKNGNGYCNVDNLQYIRCGDAFDIPKEAPALLSMAVNLLKIAVPIILIVVSVITLLKALAASKEDEIKKAQSTLVKKLIISVLIFFVISIVQFVILKVADDGEVGNLSDCLSCLLNNDCQDSLYYKNIENGISRCYYVNGGEFSCFEE